MIEPRLLDANEAAQYCGLKSSATLSHVPVQPVRIGSLVRYDRKALDRWLDGLMGLAPSSPPAANDEADEAEAALERWRSHSQSRETPRRP